MKSVALITGGARGIGLGISRRLASKNLDLAICGTRPENDVQSTLRELRELGADALYCQCDIADAERRERMLEEIKDRFGRLNVLVNNAGVAPKVRTDILEATEESYERVMGINLRGPFFLTRTVANWMIEQRRRDPDFKGTIVNVSSISATVASPSRGEYCLSKAGVAMTTKLFAVRLGEFDIPVYEIRPGVIETDMTSGVKEKYDALIEDGLCVQSRWGRPEDVGKAVAALIGGDFPYSTGAVIMVDGGLTLERL